MALDVKYLRGSKKRYEEYLRAGKIVSTNFYYLDERELYLGTIKLSNQEDIDNAIKSLESHILNNFATKGEIMDLKSELQIGIDENSFAIKELKKRVAAIEDLENEEFNQLHSELSELKISVESNTKEIVDLKTDITTLKTISSGFGGEGEPSTIMAAIDAAEERAKDFADNLMSWKED